jgi:predicted N-acetyltransferase YhbS
VQALIREARVADDGPIGELLVQAFYEQYARKMPEVVMTDSRRVNLRDVAAKRAIARVWVAEDAGRIVGTIALWPPGAEGSEAWLPGAFDLRHLAIEQAHRGTGLAARLISATEVHAREARGSAVCLHVRRGATGVAAVYTRLGYARAPEGDLDHLPEVFLEAFVKRL